LAATAFVIVTVVVASAQAAPVTYSSIVPSQPIGASTPASVEIRLIIWGVNLNDIFPDQSGIRRNLAISVADYFNNDVYATRILSADLSSTRSIVDFVVLKGGFVSWDDAELAQIWEMSASPNFYKRLADNLQVNWDIRDLTLLTPLDCASTVVCTPNDIFEFIDAGGDSLLAANRQLMLVTDVPVPPAAMAMLMGLVGVGFIRMRKRNSVSPAFPRNNRR
jgi:hypothetical protein